MIDFETLPSLDGDSADAVRERTARLIRPSGALQRLDELAMWLAAVQGSPAPSVDSPACVLFAGDHGVAREGVSAYPSSVTAGMLEAIRAGVASCNVLARCHGVELSVHDVGVGVPTGNIRTDDAMDSDRFEASFEAGRRAVPDWVDLLVVGEMGIANTTAASAVCLALFGGHPSDWVGSGTGVTGNALAVKRQVVGDAVARIGGAEPMAVARRLGGTELAAMAGATYEARIRSIPVVLDGFVSTAAAAPLIVADQRMRQHLVAGHRSSEQAHGHLLRCLDLNPPILELDMRLGEGSGALLAVPIVRAAAELATGTASFEEAGLV